MPRRSESGGRAGKEAAYRLAIRLLFKKFYRKGLTEFLFTGADYRDVCNSAAVIEANGGQQIRNQPDVLYSFRSRRPMPPEVRATAPDGKEWIIELAGKRGRDSQYRFRLVSPQSNRILPRPELAPTKIPNATPEIIAMYALSDEQAVLAKVRYNRLIDIFLGIASFSLQSHLKTHVPEHGNIEIDELYVGIDKKGCHYVIPVQAKVGRDQLNVGQLRGDLAYCARKFSSLTARAVSAQYMTNNRIALFELAITDDEIVVVDERHYLLVPAADLSPAQ
jgi:hypothetical protein